MKNEKKFKFNKIFFVGIGGISMSGLCKIARYLGSEVLGSDISINEETIKLEKMGIRVYHEHSPKNITKDIDLVVFSGAINKSNCELQKAKEMGIRIMERSKFLGVVSKLFDNVIVISGTHGKTTTCAMVGEIFTLASLNPTIHLGGESVNLDDNTIIGSSKYFIVEGCEYRESFRYLSPTILAITNIEEDHLDYYKNLNEIKVAFDKLSSNSKFLVKDINVNIKHLHKFDINKDFEAKKIKFENNGYVFDVYFQGKYYETFRLNMFGEHNVQNVLFAIAICHYVGIKKEIIKLGIESFAGVKRRCEKIGEFKSTPIYIDYAHHPTEIKKSIEGIKLAYKNPLIIFQPHTYSRTLSLMDKFVEVLKDYNVIIFKTYPAREKEIVGGRGIDLFEKLISNNERDKYLYVENVDFLNNEIVRKLEYNNYDCVVILGAGDLAEKMRKYYK